ncbi:hypothetical protein [Candidatus Nitronereus thalassa]|uniref:DUF4145 domain-containing protein n=1 Tax=Candidatus Nitronereus thalassa TaxID=3020898 RepID=A0ABU3K8T1_9BACT|nr:hypothetical protein [Candidatus Nitronereus thalassa]MDT7042854.1 hypothetical protein [Candidatus Nitronereus thalassa]
MHNAHHAVDASVSEIDKLRRTLKKNGSAQVRSGEEIALIKAVCLTWFNNHRKSLLVVIDEAFLSDQDRLYKELLTSCDRATSRKKYDQLIKQLRASLTEIRGYIVDLKPVDTTPTTDAPPSFAILVPNPIMQKILEARWLECSKCIAAGAPLAATVMMGGLLEALLLARINREPNKSHVFKTASAPKDRMTGKTLQLQEWTLRHYIDVAHELGWISTSAKDVGEVVRDYRNYIHPQKELSHGIELRDDDARLFWEIAKGISRQILK